MFTLAVVAFPEAQKKFKELGLKMEDYQIKTAVIDLLLKYPELMQRPIIIRAGRAVIARPPELLLPLLGE